MSNATRFTVTADSLAQAAAAAKTVPGLNADAERFTPEAMAAHAEWREKHTDYKGKVRDLVDQTFGLSADRNGWAAGGAALTAIRNLAEKNGLIEPRMPPAVANMLQTTGESMWTDKSGGTTGMFDIAFLPNGAEKGGNLRILFDSAKKPGADSSLVDLKNGGANAQGALTKIRTSALGASLDSAGGWNPGGSANAYALTNDTNGGGEVFGMVIANNADDYARVNSKTILETIHSLLG
ncbi:hypothetical protein DS837_13565 [Azospirillum brasilense]|uniref:Uncharacterized protein n=2 Tax=Azospirillum brasilense TaxID=192 RepID=A0A6L3B1C8_AZOBR|nr:hypothetical protein DS837_13565 [Azospirillum brasilense]